MWGRTRRKKIDIDLFLREWVIRRDRARNFSHLLSRYLDLRHSLLSLFFSLFPIAVSRDLISSIFSHFLFGLVAFAFLSGSKSGRERSKDHLCKFLYSRSSNYRIKCDKFTSLIINFSLRIVTDFDFDENLTFRTWCREKSSRLSQGDQSLMETIDQITRFSPLFLPQHLLIFPTWLHF